MGNFALNK